MTPFSKALFFAFLAYLPYWPCALAALDPIIIHVQLSQESVILPKSFIVKASVSYPKGYKLDKSTMKDNLLSAQSSTLQPLIVLNEESQIAENAGFITENIEYTLKPELPGRFALTFWQVPLIAEDAQQNPSLKAISDIAYITVELVKDKLSLDVPLANPLDMTGQLPLQWDEDAKIAWLKLKGPLAQKSFPWLLFLSCLLLLMGFFALNFKLKAKRQSLPPTQPSDEAYNKAKKLFIDIQRERGMASEEQVKEYVSLLTKALRLRFEERHHLTSAAKTSDELFFSLQDQAAISQEVALALKEFLVLADAIKFAQYQPSLHECQALQKQTNVLMQKI